jgi:hypothetical protein
MTVPSRAFAAPGAIGQGLTQLVEPNYGSNRGESNAGFGGETSVASGPFSLGGSLSLGADQSREGLATLFQAAGVTMPTGFDELTSPTGLSSLMASRPAPY